MNVDLFPELQAVQPTDAKEYLRLKGWNAVDVKEGVAAVFVKRVDAGDVQAKVALDGSFSDYAVRTAELVDVLSKVERRPFQEVLNELLAPPGDRLRFRLYSESTRSGAISIDQSIRLRLGMKQALLASAHSALEPQKHYARMSQKPAVELVEQARELQSERGSYVAALLVPIPPPMGQVTLGEDFGRRTTRTLMSAVREAARIVHGTNPDQLVDRADAGLSSNFLEALASLEPTGERSFLEVSASWLGSAPEGLGENPAVRFEQAVFRYFSQAARTLRETSAVAGVEVTGYVLSLTSSNQAEGGEVVITADIENWGQTRLHVQLPGGPYREAVGAHQEGKLVRLFGTIKKEGRVYRVLEPSGFEVLKSES